MKSVKIFRDLYAFYDVQKFRGFSFGISFDEAYDSEHFCTRDFHIHFWKFRLSMWVEDTK